MKRLFVLALAVVITLASSLGIFLFISLMPHVQMIGRVAAGVVIVGLLCVAALMIAFTYSHICLWLNRRNLIVQGEVVAYLNDGGFVHLSAQHEAAKIPLAPPAPKDELFEPQPSTDETILEMHQKGVGLRDIAKLTKNTYYHVQKVTSGKQ